MAKYEVRDSFGVVFPVFFIEEKKAISYKMEMEKKYGRVFRMDKKFDEKKRDGTIDTRDGEYVQINLVVPVGEIITFSSGALMESSLTRKHYRVKRIAVMKNGGFEAQEKSEILFEDKK